jgi:endonuclease/exonuclease/phosphatase family metal-dependent hydrolase
MIVLSIRTVILFFIFCIFLPYRLNSENFTGSANSKKNSSELDILTWNIYMLPHCSWFKGNSKRAAEIAGILESSRYDVIVFEEAFDHRARRIIRKQLKNSFPFMYGPANQNMYSLRTNSGIWVISKIPLTKIKEIEYSSRTGIDAMARKGAVMFQGEWHGKEFQLVGTHLQNDSPDEVRHQQCEEIYQELLKKYYSSDIPQIVCGDFNIEMGDSLNYNYMLDALNAENGMMEGNIHVSFDEIDNQLAKRPDGKKQMIDYILVRNSRLIESIRRRVSIFQGLDKDVITDLSDHYGIEASIFFGSAPETADAKL